MVPTETTLAAHTLVALLRHQAERYGDKVAFRFCPDGVEEQDRLTYRELDLRARAIAAGLQQLGAAGHRVLLPSFVRADPTPAFFIAAFFGCLYAGSVVVAVDDDAPRLKAIVPDAEPGFVLVSAAAQPVVQRALTALIGDDGPRWCVLDADFGDAGRTAELAEQWAPPELDGDAPAMIEYTSGSTGMPKGILLSHRNILSNVEAQYRTWAGDDQITMLSWVAPHRNAGLLATIVHPIYRGCITVMVSPVVFFTQPMRWLEAISRHRANVTVAYSRAYPTCVKRATPADIAKLDLSCLTTAIAGGELLSAADVAAFTETFAPTGFAPAALAPSYGLAHATLTVTGGSDAPAPVVQRLDRAALGGDRVVDAAPDDPFAFTVVSCGRPVPGVKVAIVDPETFEERGPDEVGEIWIAGPNVASGYWRRAEETRRTFSVFIAGTGDGPYLRSGDLGFLRDGELFFTGRWSDLITIDNANHYPGDIEETVHSTHPAFVAGRCAAFAVQPNRRTAPHLVVVQEVERDHGLGPAELAAAIDAVRAGVSSRHGIDVHDVALVEQARIPTASGKIRRGQCRQQFLDAKLSALAEWHAPAQPGAAARSSDGLPVLGRFVAGIVERLLSGNRAKGQSFKSKFKVLYPYTTRQFGSADVVFLNYGYEEDPPLGLPLAEDDEPNRLGIQLYRHVADRGPLAGKDILEVSCGHGGGASYLVRTFKPGSYTALDYNAEGIAFCRRRHRLAGLDFVTGDAQNLPFPDGSFDVVLNVEASHGYPDFEKFLREVVRVLRPGGHFRYADLRRRDEIPAWEAALAAVPMRLLSEQVINEQTARALRINSPRLVDLIDNHATPQLRHFYREFAAVEGTENYRNLASGQTSYRAYSFVKD